MHPPSDSSDPADRTVAESMLRSLAEYDVDYVFSNFGTDHTPIIEAAAQLREAGEADAFPELVPCPHEFVALSAAHGYAQASGDPQAVLVHVDVGTQNLGAAMHNAHRANAPVLIMAGLAPVSDEGYLGSRDNPIHYYQDVFDQTGIVEEYCRWTNEYRTPADPTEAIRRGLERTSATPPGPTYLSFSREALEAPTPASPGELGSIRRTRPAGADDESVAAVVDRLEAAENPLVITSSAPGPLGDWQVDALVSFAEAAGAGVVEHYPTELCFPRDHELHVGFDPGEPLSETDLLVLLETDVPWVPSKTDVPDDLTTIQIDTNPTKPEFRSWPFDADVTVMADPASTLRTITAQLESGGDGSVWREMHRDSAEAAQRRAADHRANERLTATVLSDEISNHVDEETVVLQGALTNRPAALDQITLSEPGSYYWRGGAGLGWGVPAGIGVKLASPESRVISLIGDGGYLFSNPAASALAAENAGTATLTVVYNNESWESVRAATRSQHGSGTAVAQGVPEGRYGDAADLSCISEVTDTFSRRIEAFDSLEETVAEAIDAVDNGTNAVLDVRVEN
ncbi:thiamine pyrophosphate-requiring protein [Natrarchaeobius oligotrophus]|uniref:Thiamine pyrophosphate-requiring protein n=1 Tax=Natrarchaeobius chitinivorans TaxID=1679083 RepID=A0A3N6PM37_NATCH|nr:thiamine pyrophosphate-requiring protein [Natrarchaeobius chitinivorans]RQH02610.1 thiamine pyrophosphate-requiring protein [Natrarchaeobius chitinivorans]